jgi:hypothetical protein
MPLRGTQDAENWYDVSGDDACCTTYPGYGAHIVLLAARAPVNSGVGELYESSVFTPQYFRSRGTEGDETTSNASSLATITIGLNLTGGEFRLLCFPLCSLWLCGGSSGFAHHLG